MQAVSIQCDMQAVGQLCSRHSRGAEHLRRGHVSDAAAAQPAQQAARQRSRSTVSAGGPQAAAKSSRQPAARRPAVSLRVHPRRLCKVSRHSPPHNPATVVFSVSETYRASRRLTSSAAVPCRCACYTRLPHQTLCQCPLAALPLLLLQLDIRRNIAQSMRTLVITRDHLASMRCLAHQESMWPLTGRLVIVQGGSHRAAAGGLGPGRLRGCRLRRCRSAAARRHLRSREPPADRGGAGRPAPGGGVLAGPQ
jgi:hypothetical protein